MISTHSPFWALIEFEGKKSLQLVPGRRYRSQRQGSAEAQSEVPVRCAQVEGLDGLRDLRGDGLEDRVKWDRGPPEERIKALRDD